MTSPLADVDSTHFLSHVVWDGRQVTASFAGDESKSRAQSEADRLSDAGNPDVVVWEQRACAWVNTKIRGDSSHIAGLEVGGMTVIAYFRRLAEIAEAHQPAKSGRKACGECGKPYPCRTYRAASAPINPL